MQASWSSDRTGQPFPRDGQGFAQRGDVAYYVGAKLGIAEAGPIYRALATTSFPTLYAAMNPWYDFAESFATYVHVVLLRKPWEVQVRGIGDDVETFGPCWGQPRCERKERVLRALLGP